MKSSHALSSLAAGCLVAASALLCPNPVSAQPASRGPALLRAIPADAKLAVVFKKGAFSLQKQWFKKVPGMQTELAEFLRERVGLDLTGIEAAVGFVTRVKPEPDGVLLLRLSAPGKLKGKRAGRHRGVAMIAVDGKKVVAAQLPAGLVLGDRAAVKQTIDRVKKRTPALAAGSPLGPLLQAAKQPGVLVAAAIHPPSINDRDMDKLVKQFGVRSVVATFDKKRRFSLEVSGAPARLALAKVAISQMIQMAESKLQREKDRARAGDDAGKALATIAAYHQFRAFVAEAEPQLHGDRLVSTYQLPELQSAPLLVGSAGILAAVAIPAFVKYTRKAKATEARVNLARLRAEVTRYNAMYQGPPGAFTFPKTTRWSPKRPCCGRKGNRCKPGAKAFDHPTWKTLQFKPDTTHYYQYRFTSRGRGKNASFAIEARGDLDCDGKFSSSKISGKRTANGSIRWKRWMDRDALE